MNNRSLHVVALGCLLGNLVAAGNDPFVGKWKLNTEKTEMVGQQETIEDLGGNKYKFVFGDDIETIVADGTDQPTKYGDMWSVKQESPNTWKSITKRKGKVTSTSTWTISDDGQQFTATTNGNRPDGSTYTDGFKAKRISGTSGLAGTWQSTEMKFGSPTDWEIAAYGSDGLSFITAADKEKLDLKFDGKDYPDHGPRVAPGSTSSGKRIDERTIELTDKLKGKTIDTQQIKVSEDGKTLTIVMRFAGVEKPSTIVYDRL